MKVMWVCRSDCDAFTFQNTKAWINILRGDRPSINNRRNLLLTTNKIRHSFEDAFDINRGEFTQNCQIFRCFKVLQS